MTPVKMLFSSFSSTYILMPKINQLIDNQMNILKTLE
jgi:hypothetical protein